MLGTAGTPLVYLSHNIIDTLLATTTTTTTTLFLLIEELILKMPVIIQPEKYHYLVFVQNVEYQDIPNSNFVICYACVK
jgi:cytochrome bd-type quinol oxidase subunit 2